MKSLPTVAANRHTEPTKLSTLVRGELDWIVMKSLEKDRGRRYDSANGLATDIERFLDGRPVEAHPPSALYRMSKFARRYRLPVATASTILVLLIVAVVATSITLKYASNALRAERAAREDAERERVRANQIAFELREKIFDQGLERVFSANMEEANRMVERLREIGATDLAQKLEAAVLAYCASSRSSCCLVFRLRLPPTGDRFPIGSVDPLHVSAYP